MSGRRSALAGEHDERLAASLRSAAERHVADEAALAEYICEAYRCRWTYRLIGEAMRMPAARVARIRHRDLKRRGLV